MKIKTSELSGVALNWAAGMAMGFELGLYGVGPSIRARVPGLGVMAPWAPTRKWEQVGLIIDQIKGLEMKNWLESKADSRAEVHIHNYEGDWIAFGPTLQVALLRCFMDYKLGAEVDLPDIPGWPEWSRLVLVS